MKKLKIYLDTSIVSNAIDDRDPEMRRLTLKLYDEIKSGKYEVFTSDLVLFEVKKADENTGDKILDALKSIDFEELELSEEVRDLADKYLEEKVIPIKYIDDALHIAVATINDIDVVVSWNFEHMVKHNTRVKVMGINTLMGYKIVDICSPKEVIEDV